MARIVALDDGRLIVNPGSVGLPAYTDDPAGAACDADGRAACALRRARAPQGEPSPWQVSFRVVAYDWDAAAERAAAKGREDWAHCLDRVRGMRAPRNSRS